MDPSDVTVKPLSLEDIAAAAVLLERSAAKSFDQILRHSIDFVLFYAMPFWLFCRVSLCQKGQFRSLELSFQPLQFLT